MSANNQHDDEAETLMADGMRSMSVAHRRSLMLMACELLVKPCWVLASMHDIGETFDSPRLTRLLALAAEIRDLMLGVEGAPQ